VRADLEHNPRAQVTGEVPLQGRGRRAQAVGRHQPPADVHGAELREAIAEIEADR
jgi:hypothetical protein